MTTKPTTCGPLSTKEIQRIQEQFDRAKAKYPNPLRDRLDPKGAQKMPSNANAAPLWQSYVNDDEETIENARVRSFELVDVLGFIRDHTHWKDRHPLLEDAFRLAIDIKNAHQAYENHGGYETPETPMCLRKYLEDAE